MGDPGGRRSTSRPPRPPPLFRRGAGTPLLLLHGAGGTWTQWAPALPELQRSHDVLAPTMAGHWGGPAADRVEPMTIDALTDSVEGVMALVGSARR
jgi:pimeloyl-ACP methyl ester carboxylesterase